MTTAEFVEELTSFRPVLFSFSLKLTKDYQDAQDLFQDGAARGFYYCNRFEMGSNFRAWMSTIIHHSFINNYRANKNRRIMSEPIENFTPAMGNQYFGSNPAEMNMRLQEIYKMLDRLDKKFAVPFVLHYQGYAYKELAEYLDLPVGTVKSRLHTARKLLKEMILTTAHT